MAAPRRGKRIDTAQGVQIVGKAANGEGSAYYVKARDRWLATYISSDGKRRTATGRTKAEALANRDAKLAQQQVATASPLGKQPTVADLCTYWLDYCADVRPTTRIAYEAHVRHIVRELGTVHVDDLTIDRVRKFLATMGKRYARDTVVNVRARLRQIAQEAVRLELLAHNPVEAVPAPRNGPKGRGGRRVLTIDETHRIIAACPDHRLGAAVAWLFLLGNRSNEVLGICWEDLDLDAGTATVRRGSTFLGHGGGQTLAPTKTRSTVGLHYLPPSLVDLLHLRRKAQAAERLAAGPAWQITTYEGATVSPVFTNPAGRLTLSQELYRAVREVAEAAGLDPDGIATHTGRRSVVTALYGAGLSLDDVARLVGHAAPTTTVGYVQHLGSRPEQTARIAAQLLDPAAGERR